MVSWGYIDDSAKGDSLVLSCVIIESSAGFWLELEWKAVIQRKMQNLSNPDALQSLVFTGPIAMPAWENSGIGIRRRIKSPSFGRCKV